MTFGSGGRRSIQLSYRRLAAMLAGTARGKHIGGQHGREGSCDQYVAKSALFLTFPGHCGITILRKSTWEKGTTQEVDP